MIREAHGKTKVGIPSRSLLKIESMSTSGTLSVMPLATSFGMDGWSIFGKVIVVQTWIRQRWTAPPTYN